MRFVLVLCAFTVGCSSAVGPEVGIPNPRHPLPGVLSGGQPTEAHLEALAAAGYRTVINLRTAGEPGFEWEADKVHELGMRYVHLPVAGADGLTRDNVDALSRALDDAEAPVLLHCGSGNRIGAMLALKAAWVDGVPAEEALRYGLDSGLTRLEGAVKEKLALETTD